MIPDPTAAVVAYLLGRTDVANLVGVRVYGVEIPGEEIVNMPQKLVAIKPTGGGVHRGYAHYSVGRFDVLSYGETPFEAQRVELVVRDTLKNMPRATANHTVLEWASVEGGPLALRDPDAHWPFVLTVYNVMSSDVEVP